MHTFITWNTKNLIYKSNQRHFFYFLIYFVDRFDKWRTLSRNDATVSRSVDHQHQETNTTMGVYSNESGGGWGGKTKNFFQEF